MCILFCILIDDVLSEIGFVNLISTDYVGDCRYSDLKHVIKFENL